MQDDGELHVHGRMRALEGAGPLDAGRGARGRPRPRQRLNGTVQEGPRLVMIRQLGRRLVMIRQRLKAEQVTTAWLGRSRRSGQGRLPE